MKCVTESLFVDRLILSPELPLRSRDCVWSLPDTAVSQTPCFLLALLACKALNAEVPRTQRKGRQMQ